MGVNWLTGVREGLEITVYTASWSSTLLIYKCFPVLLRHCPVIMYSICQLSCSTLYIFYKFFFCLLIECSFSEGNTFLLSQYCTYNCLFFIIVSTICICIGAYIILIYYYLIYGQITAWWPCWPCSIAQDKLMIRLKWHDFLRSRMFLLYKNISKYFLNEVLFVFHKCERNFRPGTVLPKYGKNICPCAILGRNILLRIC